MQKLLFISPELPYPAQSGGKVKTLKLVQSLAAHYQVTFVSPLKLEDPMYREEFARVSGCVRHVHAPLDVPRSAASLLRSYARGCPLNVVRSLEPGLKREVEALAPEHDIIFLDHYETSAYLPKDYHGMVVYHAHNAYFKIWERYSSLPGNPAMRLAAYAEAWRVRRRERDVARRADLVFAAPNDARELVASGVPNDRIRDTYHLGDDTQLELPELRFDDTRKKLMYVGFLGWEPNTQGLLWFIDEVWPLLVDRHPDLEFDIVGKNPDARLKEAAAGYSGINLLGYVADLQSVYCDSRVSVAPLLFGSGMKVKVLDSMARGIPTVTTTVGAEGIDAHSGVQLMVEDEPRAMAERIGQLLHDRELWEGVQVFSRQLIARQYTWRRLFASMHGDMDSAFAAYRDGSGRMPEGLVANAG